MKKIIICISVTIFLLLSVASADQDFDVSKYTLEDLVKLRSIIEEELNSRVRTTTATLQPGKYIVGVDIAEGSYILVGLMDKGPSDSTPQVLYAESMDKAKNWEYLDYAYLEEGENWRISLQNEMVLEVREGNCAIQKAAPMIFAPN